MESTGTNGKSGAARFWRGARRGAGASESGGGPGGPVGVQGWRGKKRRSQGRRAWTGLAGCAPAPPASAACSGHGLRARTEPLPASPNLVCFGKHKPRSLLNREHDRKSEGFRLSQGKIFKLAKALQLLQRNADEEKMQHQVSLE